MAMPARHDIDAEQPMLGGFEAVPGIDTPYEAPEPRPMTQGSNEGSRLDDFERPYDELGGGTKEHGMVDPPKFSQPHRPPRHIGHVRYVEGSDSGHDPYWNTPGEPTAAEAANNRTMVETLRKELAASRVAGLLKQGVEPSQVAAQERARQEKRLRRK